MTIRDEQGDYKLSVRCDLSALKTDLTTRGALERTWLGLDSAPDWSTLLRVLAGPAIDAGAIEAVLDFIDLNQTEKPEWAKTVAVWQRPGRSRIPIGVRYHIPEFSCFKLWLSSPQSPLYLTDIKTDERLGASMREVFLEMQQQAMVIIPLRHDDRWVGLLFFIWDQPHIFSRQECAVYKALMKLASSLIANFCLLHSMENKRSLRDKALRGAAERYRELFDIAPHGVAFVDLDGHLIECNQAYLDMLGYASMEEVQHAPACHEAQANLIKKQGLVRESCATYIAHNLRPAEYLRKDGQRLQVFVQTWLSYNKRGTPIGMWIACHTDGADQG